MTVNKKWIEDLRNLIKDEEDKILFDETTGCFLTQHYRAAYILSWITIVESLKRKINLFSNLGDIRASNAVKDIEEAEDKKLSVDRLILEESKKCGIIDSADLSTINYLWEQRCLFAHPYNKQPDIDEVKHIIGQSIKLVLGRHLLYNKDFLVNLCENITNKPFFLPYEIVKVQEFATRAIARTPINLHPFFFKTLLFKVGQIIEVPEKFNELKKLRCYLVVLFAKTELDLSDDKWSLEDRVTKFPYECIFGFVHVGVWGKLPMRIKEMLIAYIIIENDTKKLTYLNDLVRKLIEKNKLEESFKIKFYSKLKKLDFNFVINFYGDNNSKYDRVITELISWQYNQQNSVIDYLKTEGAVGFLGSLDIDKQLNLGRLLRACASEGHWKTQSLLTDVSNGTVDMPENFKAGIAFSSFVDRKDKYSLNTDSVERAVKLLNTLSDEVREKVYLNINKALDEHIPDELEKIFYAEPPMMQLSASVHNSIDEWHDSNKEYFDKLIEKTINHFS